MLKYLCTLIGTLAVMLNSPGIAMAQPAPRPQVQTTRVPGTDNVYIFRNGNYQSMFVVTEEGVIATDPIAYGRPNGSREYLAEIRKLTDKPLKYVIYSHHHLDHIAGGRALKDEGAVFVAHHRAKQRLERLADPHTILPDIAVGDNGSTIRLGGTELILSYHGLNHSDSNLVMRLPREKIVFVVDTIPIGQVPGRGMIDFHPIEAEDFIRAVLGMDWETLIPGHPAPGDRLGTKKDVQDQLELLQTASATMKELARQGKCWEPAEKEFQLPAYENWPGYAAGLPFIARRYCGLWGRGT